MTEPDATYTLENKKNNNGRVIVVGIIVALIIVGAILLIVLLPKDKAVPVCKNGEELVGSKCLVKCPDGQVREGDICKIRCKDGEELVGSKCLVKCPDGQVREGDICKIRCKDGEELFGTKCLPKCPAGQARYGETCKDASQTCLPNQVRINQLCVDKCTPEQELINNMCVKKCGNGEILLEGKCTKPPQTTYKFYQGMVGADKSTFTGAFGDTVGRLCSATPDCVGWHQNGWLIQKFKPMREWGRADAASYSHKGSYVKVDPSYTEPSYTFHQGVVSDGNVLVDLNKESNNADYLRGVCNEEPTCKAWRTDGKLLTNVDPDRTKWMRAPSWPQTGALDPSYGMWVKN